MFLVYSCQAKSAHAVQEVDMTRRAAGWDGHPASQDQSIKHIIDYKYVVVFFLVTISLFLWPWKPVGTFRKYTSVNLPSSVHRIDNFADSFSQII